MIPTYSEGRGRIWRMARLPAESSLQAWGAATARWRQPPDFLVIGGRRCGSTSLYYGLLQHPGVMPLVLSAGWLPLKEHRKGTRWLDQPRRGGPWYRAHFPTDLTRRRYERRAGVALTGEATPWYLAAPGAAQRAAVEAPAAKLILVVRDPVARAFSQFVEQRKRGHEPEPDFALALQKETERRLNGLLGDDGVHRSPAFANEHLSYRRQSEYASCLEPWLARYPLERLLVVQAEDLYNDGPAVLGEVAGFLGLGPHEFAAEDRNKTRSDLVDSTVATELRDYYRPHNQRLETLVGRRFNWSS